MPSWAGQPELGVGAGKDVYLMPVASGQKQSPYRTAFPLPSWRWLSTQSTNAARSSTELLAAQAPSPALAAERSTHRTAPTAGAARRNTRG